MGEVGIGDTDEFANTDIDGILEAGVVNDSGNSEGGDSDAENEACVDEDGVPDEEDEEDAADEEDEENEDSEDFEGETDDNEEGDSDEDMFVSAMGKSIHPSQTQKSTTLGTPIKKLTPPKESDIPDLSIILNVNSLEANLACSENNTVTLKTEKFTFDWASFTKMPLMLDLMSIEAQKLSLQHSTSPLPLLENCHLITALKMDTDFDRSIQRILAAVNVIGASIRPDFKEKGHNIWEQLLLYQSAFDEAPVLGYEPPQVITDLHTHLIDSKIVYGTTPDDLLKKHQYFNYNLDAELLFSNLSLNTKILVNQPEHVITVITDGMKFKLNRATIVEMDFDIEVLIKNDVVLSQSNNLVPPEVDVKLTVERVKVLGFGVEKCGILRLSLLSFDQNFKI